jgi:nitrogen fixation/metabolism regulation signal transduction histidine kinase
MSLWVEVRLDMDPTTGSPAVRNPETNALEPIKMTALKVPARFREVLKKEAEELKAYTKLVNQTPGIDAKSFVEAFPDWAAVKKELKLKKDSAWNRKEHNKLLKAVQFLAKKNGF